MHATDIVAYTYRAETLCPGCTLDALNVPHSLRAEQSVESILEMLADAQGVNWQDAHSFDSDDFPKVVFADQIEDCGTEGCTPESCGNATCDNCGEELI